MAYHLFKLFRVRESYIDLKVEAVYEKMLLTSVKKKYVKVENGELKIVGFEERRRETLPIAAAYQRLLFKKLLLKDRTIEEIIKWIKKIKRKVIMKQLSKEEVTLQIKLSKNVEDYRKRKKNKDGEETNEWIASKLPHVKVANYLKENGIKENGYNSWEKGCYVKYIVTGKERGKGITACSIYNYENNYSPEYYWDVKIYAILERVLSSVFPKHNWNQYYQEEKKKILKIKTKK